MKSLYSKVFIGLFAGILLLGSATVTHAAQLTSAQVQAVISLLQTFNVDPSTIANVQASLTGQTSSGGWVPSPVTIPSQWCPSLTRNLYQGLTDATTDYQVSQLQQYLGLAPTGYFGRITRARVASLQSQHGLLVTGGVGPLTRDLIQRDCRGGIPTPIPTPPPTEGTTFNLNAPFSVAVGQTVTENSLGQLNIQVVSISGASAQVTVGENCQRGTQCFYYPTKTVWMLLNQPLDFQSYSIILTRISDRYATFSVTSSKAHTAFNAMPLSGAAPLSVLFAGTANAGCNGGEFEIAYGDGQSDIVSIPADACTRQFAKNHTYATAGTYTATLSRYIACFYTTPRCMMAQPAPIGTVIITVMDSGSIAAPTVSSVVPSQGVVGSPITIRGTGFTNDNTVHFGWGGTQHMASRENGTVITYTSPQAVGPCDLVTSGKTMCATALQLVTPGVYNVSVSNANGQSSKKLFTVVSPTSSSITIQSPSTGSIFTRGQTLPIIWMTEPTVPPYSYLTFDLYTEAAVNVGTVAIVRNDTGFYNWPIPGFPQTYLCTTQYPNMLCGGSIPTGTYYIKATATSNAGTLSSEATLLYGTGKSGLFTIN